LKKSSVNYYLFSLDYMSSKTKTSVVERKPQPGDWDYPKYLLSNLLGLFGYVLTWLKILFVDYPHEGGVDAQEMRCLSWLVYSLAKLMELFPSEWKTVSGMVKTIPESTLKSLIDKLIKEADAKRSPLLQRAAQLLIACLVPHVRPGSTANPLMVLGPDTDLEELYLELSIALRDFPSTIRALCVLMLHDADTLKYLRALKSVDLFTTKTPTGRVSKTDPVTAATCLRGLMYTRMIQYVAKLQERERQADRRRGIGIASLGYHYVSTERLLISLGADPRYMTSDDAIVAYVTRNPLYVLLKNRWVRKALVIEA